MAHKQTYLDGLAKVANIAGASRWGRLLRDPVRYCSAIGFRELGYRRHRTPRRVTVQPFFGGNMTVLLPASTDIYLTGGKSHDSEIRLARFLIERLTPGDHFLDVGAHYGYFSRLGAALVGKTGRVVAIEAAPDTFAILGENAGAEPQLTALQLAVSDTVGHLDFYAFPNQYSEYNTTDPGQFAGAAWLAENPPVRHRIPADTLDAIAGREALTPRVIKIDVEGAELLVLRGAENLLSAQSPAVVVEYLTAERGNTAHRAAADLLRSLGYGSYRIGPDGRLEVLPDIEGYLTGAGMDSDNVVFDRTQ